MLSLIYDGPHREQVIVILQMLFWSGGILPLEACNDAIAVCPGKSYEFNTNDRFFDPSKLVEFCSGLVTIANHDGYYREYLVLSHASVQDYLSSVDLFRPCQQHLCEEVARLSILRICLAYLNCVDWSIFENAQSGDKGCFDGYDHRYSALAVRPKELIARFPFALWAQKFWIEHAKALEGTNEDARSLVLVFLRNPVTRRRPAILFNILSFDGIDPDQPYPLYLAACAGLSITCRQLIELDYTPSDSKPLNDTSAATSDTKGHDLKLHLGPCLLVASFGGHVEVVQELLRHGVDPNFTGALEFEEQGAQRGTALCFAASNGHNDIVQLLINNGASVDHSCVVSPERTAL